MIFGGCNDLCSDLRQAAELLSRGEMTSVLQTNLSAALVHAPDTSTRLQVGCLTLPPA